MANPIIEADVEKVSVSLGKVYKNLRGRRILLTGGTGFFGKWLLHSFLGLNKAYGIDVGLTVLSRDPDRFLKTNPEFYGQSGIDFIAGDVRSFAVPAGWNVDFVVHAATAASAKLEQENPDEMYSVITDGTRHILDFVQQCSVKRLLFISSGAVYGPQPPTLSRVPETYDGSPVTAYGKGKKVSEQMCLEAADGKFECVVARPFAFVGPYLPLDVHFAIGNFILDCLEKRDIVIQGDGTPLRSYLYAADLAEWLWTILLRGEHGCAYNVGSDEAISILDLARLVRTCADTRNEIIVRGKRVEGAPTALYVPCIERARNELGLTVCYGVADAISRTIAWHRENKL
jgi:dTDP-glucose 4,6-dehydratase